MSLIRHAPRCVADAQVLDNGAFAAQMITHAEATLVERWAMWELTRRHPEQAGGRQVQRAPRPLGARVCDLLVAAISAARAATTADAGASFVAGVGAVSSRLL